jgi:hypothetical protein
LQNPFGYREPNRLSLYFQDKVKFMLPRLFSVLLFALGLSACEIYLVDASPQVSFALPKKPAMTEVEFIEQNLQMPTGANALVKYNRYYAAEIVDGQRFIRGKFIIAESDPKIFIVDIGDFPAEFDGGCGIVLLRYSVARKHIDVVRCSGIS